jgi:hypothetical protein
MRTPLERARDNVLNATARYNRAWRAQPTAKGYPRVDKALDKLEAAEREFAAVLEAQ